MVRRLVIGSDEPIDRFVSWQLEQDVKVSVPSNTGKVRVAMALGGKYVVWNGKQGKNEFSITCRNRKQAEVLARIINSRQHGGEVVVD